jgi:hypothetical protein
MEASCITLVTALKRSMCNLAPLFLLQQRKNVSHAIRASISHSSSLSTAMHLNIVALPRAFPVAFEVPAVADCFALPLSVGFFLKICFATLLVQFFVLSCFFFALQADSCISTSSSTGILVAEVENVPLNGSPSGLSHFFTGEIFTSYPNSFFAKPLVASCKRTHAVQGALIVAPLHLSARKS